MHTKIFTDEAKAAIRDRAPLFEHAHILAPLHAIHWPEIERIQIRRANLTQMIARIAACAQNGEVAAVESGRDCDGVEYSGHVHMIPATIGAFRELHNRLDSWADGPFSLGIVSPSEAADIVPESRDLVAEAYEDGHSHVIYSNFHNF